MALTTCSECGKEISKKAESCPHCGEPGSKPFKLGCGGAIVIILFLGWLGSNVSPPPKPVAKVNEKALYAKARKLPASDLEGNLLLYAQLMDINPKNETYKRKWKHYDTKVKTKLKAIKAKNAKIEKKWKELEAKFGDRPVQSGWDGSYRVVTIYLETVANDPDSIKIDNCTKIYHIAEGWLVGCDYRGKNAFGGVVRNSNWFIIVENRVVKMKPSDAYNP